MRILVCSDLHLNYYEDHGESFIHELDNTGIDAVVIAGDLTVGRFIGPTLQWFAMHFQNSPVLYVPGNHEWYGFPEKDIRNFIKQKEGNFANLHWLDDKVIEIPSTNKLGQYELKRFVGTTLWYPATADSILQKDHWSDFRYIPDANKKIFKWNKAAVAFLEKEVKEGDIVISHMMPSYQSVAPQYKGDPNNCFFVCDLENFIVARKPAAWIHGHTHNSFDYMIDKTRVVCNPRGYPRFIMPSEPNKKFDSDLTIEV